MEALTLPEINELIASGAEQLVNYSKTLSDANPHFAMGMLLVGACSLAKHMGMDPDEFMRGVHIAYTGTTNEYATHH